MKSTSTRMKRQTIVFFISAFFTIALLSACNKTNEPISQVKGGPYQPSSFSAEVIEKWMAMQVRLMKNAAGIPNQAFSRHYVYSGIAALESIAPSLPASGAWTKKWNGLSGLPQAEPAKSYYWPANVNAALAAINRSMFPNASPADLAAVDSLENILHQGFLAHHDPSVVAASALFGKNVADAVYAWAQTDGHQHASDPYTIPVGPGLWVPTSAAGPSTPYWGNNRPVITSSIVNTQPAAPISYSTEVNSPFYNMVAEVYEASQNLTPDQKAMAMFWRDVPGVTSPGHWLNILRQTVLQTNTSLAKAALAYALTGAAIHDGLISCWKTKYHFSLVRPVTYIRDVMGHTGWDTYLSTPPHPEYSSAHAVLSTAAAEVFEKLFGNIGSFTDHTFDYMGLASRTYSSFAAIGREASESRFYAGIHYRPSIEAGILQGKKVAGNILSATAHSNQQ